MVKRERMTGLLLLLCFAFQSRKTASLYLKDSVWNDHVLSLMLEVFKHIFFFSSFLYHFQCYHNCLYECRVNTLLLYINYLIKAKILNVNVWVKIEALTLIFQRLGKFRLNLCLIKFVQEKTSLSQVH